MNRKTPLAAPKRSAILIEALEPRIAPAGLLNESKFTSVAVGTPLLLDASGTPGTFQGLTTGSGGGSGSYLLYLTSGRALVFTTDLNGNGRLDPGEITGISLGKDSLGHDPALLLFSDVNGDIVTNLQGTSGSLLTDSDRIANNGRDGKVLTDTNIAGITLRTLTASDIDPSIAGNTVNARLALTSFSIHGNVIAGGSISSVLFDTSGNTLLRTKFDGSIGVSLFTGDTPTITGLYTGTAANNLDYHFTQNNPFLPQVEGAIQPFRTPAGEHGGDITSVKAATAAMTFSIGTLATGDGGTGARGGNLANVTMHGDTGGYQLIAGNGGDGATGGQGGSITGFNDLGSVTGEVILHTGDGGTGLLGNGGAGGVAIFATTNIAASVKVLMGRGGDGSGSGGAGASFNTGNFLTPETVNPVGGKFLGTWHDLGDVGNTHPITNADGTLSYAPQVLDFNGDGYGDGIFTTVASSPDAINVVFGDGFGGLTNNGNNFNGSANATVSLKVPGVINPVVTVGDFNGDGRPDIAVASGDPNNTSGIFVFLDQIGTPLDPINAHNFTHNPVGDHPFSAAHQTALPSLADQNYFQTSGGIVALAAGDYNGDGITDIAFVQNVTGIDSTLPPFQSIGVLLGDGARDATSGLQLQNGTTHKLVGTGFFHANTAPPRAAAALLNIVVKPGTGDALLATSLTSGNLPDTTTGLPAAAETFLFFAQGADSYTPYHVGVLGLVGVAVPLGNVDTNRNTGGTNVSSVTATVQALSIQDVDQDGSADVVALTKVPTNFLVDFKGDGAGGFAVQSAPSADNAGIFLGQSATGIALTAVDTNTDAAHVGTFDNVAVLTLPTDPGPIIAEFLLRTANGTPSFYYANGAPTAGRISPVLAPIQDQTVQGLDAFYVSTTDANGNPHPLTGYGVLTPESLDYNYADLSIVTPQAIYPLPLDNTSPLVVTAQPYLTQNGYVIHSGDGGNGTSGSGGNAGVIGGTTGTIASGAGAVAITFPVALSYEGSGFLQGGNGGNGFAAGGVGGDVTGVTGRYASGTTLETSTIQTAAGNGGNGISGDGGRGGNLSSLSIETGTTFTAGNGGNGLHGGTGGSITGNQTGVFDTSTTTVQLITGTGGEGALQGGSGGSISKWDSQFAKFLGTGGGLTYATGAGGGAAGGTGGDGGSILNSSPDQTQNNLSGSLTLVTGAGGGGLTGGNGGAINTFINSTTNQSALPTALTVVTGKGGVGVSGSGGTGGAITNFSSNATGLTSGTQQDLAGIGRIIAGDGGASFGGLGGLGGSITTVRATATSTPLVVAAGAGGSGLTVGGAGGSVTNSSINSAAQQIGKMLVVGGIGGDALAAQPQDITLLSDADTTDLAHTVLAFGGVRGTAGDGGNITNIIQPVGAQTAVDLIAGNGGSTPNAGTALTASTGVGRGGSVTGVTLTGTVGAISRDTTLGAITNPPIKSYSFTDPNGATNNSISAFVDFIAAGADQNNASYYLSRAFVLDDSVGNVGIVAGAAGTTRLSQPAQDGVNGDVTNITAASVMSIVAGSVDAVAPVRVVSGITLTNSDGVLGADRSPTTPYGPNGVLDYYNPALGRVVTTLESGDALIDGAIFASTVQSTAGNQLSGPRVF